MLRLTFLLFSLAGAVVPWVYNVMVFQATGGFDAWQFVTQGFRGGPMLGSLAADFWIGSTVSLIWLVAEARRLGMKRPWAYVIVALLVAWACALPLFFFMRERHLRAQHRVTVKRQAG